MWVKERVKFIKNGNKYTIVVSGRTREELQDRIEKILGRELTNGAELR